jgi:hypothetical protein
VIGALIADWRRERMRRREIAFRGERGAAEIADATTGEQRIDAFQRACLDIGTIAGFTGDDWRQQAARLEEQCKRKRTWSPAMKPTR